MDDSLTLYRGFVVGFCNMHCGDDFAGDTVGNEKDREFFDSAIEALRR